MARGERKGGGKGPKPTFTRVIPKFLQQYETMLTGPKPSPDDGEEVFSGGGNYTDAGGGSAGGSGGMPGRVGRSKSEGAGAGEAAGGGGASGGGASGGNGFGDYDEEEVAALEAYMKTHPSKEEDRKALRDRARELSANIGSAERKSTRGGGAQAGGSQASGPQGGLTTKKSPPPPEEPPVEYVDASGRLKFNKRPGAGGSVAGAGAEGGDGGDMGGKQKRKRAKLKKLNNAKLLSFQDDDDGG